MQKSKSKLSDMERGIMDLLSDGTPVWIPDEKVDMSVFSEYPKAREGIAIYYPIYRDGSCASPLYVKFFRSPQGISMELATEHEYYLQEKERIGHLLRR